MQDYIKSTLSEVVIFVNKRNFCLQRETGGNERFYQSVSKLLCAASQMAGLKDCNRPSIARSRTDHVTEVKIKLNMSLCLTEHQDMEVYWGVEVQIHTF
jgi:hypothetical protein